MDTLFLWPPVLWAARVVLLMTLVVIGVGVVVFIVRVLHPRNVWAMLTGHLPSVFPASGQVASVELGGGVTVRYLPEIVMSDLVANSRPRPPQPN